MSHRGAHTVLGAVACGLTLAGMGAWAQPRHEPPARHGSPRTDAGVTAGGPRRETAHRDAGVDVALRPPTHGTVDTAATQRVLAAHATAAQRCYESGLAHDPTLHGRVVVRLRVEPDGRVSDTSSESDDVMRGVGRCIETVYAGVTFPLPTGGAATVAAPFDFAVRE